MSHNRAVQRHHDRRNASRNFGTRTFVCRRRSPRTSSACCEPLFLRFSKANDDLGKRVLKEIVVDGFTDKTGSYLSNLDLSLQRSQRVLCALFAKAGPEEQAMTPEQLEHVRALFVVGGYSFNAAKETDDESRRVEMRLSSSVREKRASRGRCAWELRQLRAWLIILPSKLKSPGARVPGSSGEALGCRAHDRPTRASRTP